MPRMTFCLRAASSKGKREGVGRGRGKTEAAAEEDKPAGLAHWRERDHLASSVR